MKVIDPLEKEYRITFKEMLKKKLLTIALIKKLENTESLIRKLEICKNLLNSNSQKYQTCEDLIDRFSKEIELNKQIISKLNSITSYSDRLKYLQQLVDTKNSLLILHKQSIQLKIKFTYDLSFALANLDKIDHQTLKAKISSNISLHKQNTNVKGKKKKLKSKTPYEHGFTKSSIRAISTPMYS